MSIKEYLKSLGMAPTNIQITVVTQARMRKKDNPFKDVTKVQSLKCQVNYDYEKIMGAEHGGWVSDHRKWGEHVEGQCLISHNDKLYVSVYVREATDPIYFNRAAIISLADLASFLSVPSKSPVRDINIANIVLW